MQGLKVDDRYVKYDIAAAFDFVLNISNPRLVRAVRMYELQTAVLIGMKILPCQRRKLEHPDNWIRASRAALSSARSVARVRLLEHLIAEKHPGAGRRAPLKKLFRDEESMQILRRIITPQKSKQTAYTLSWRELDNLMTTRRS